MKTGTVVLKLADDISTDIIYPGRFMATVLPSETPQFAFADDTEFNGRLQAGQVPEGAVIAGGDNFGCGSSREQAASCIVGHGLTVVARSVARIFLQNAINLGLDIVICPDFEAEEGDSLEFGLDQVVVRPSGRTYPTVPLPPARQAVIDAGGLIPYTRQLLLERNSGRAG